MNKPKVILDSGAYTMHRKGIIIDIDEYAQYITKHSDKYVGCFTLDTIGDAKKSYDNWKYLQQKGVETIPVYHIGTDEKWLEKYLNETDYIALGAIANLDTSQRMISLDRIWKQYFIDKKGFPKVKVHGLGLTAIPIMIRLPWYSVDSFTPVISAVWGSILLPKLNNVGEPYYLDTFICKISDQANHKKGTRNSFPNLPKRQQVFYQQMFTDAGFTLGDISYQERRPRRGQNDEITRKPKPMFDLLRPSDMEIKTLANHWEERMRWNLTFWIELQKRLPKYPRKIRDGEYRPKQRATTLPKTLMYMGVSTMTHLDIFDLVTPKLDILISYAYLNDNISKKITKYTK